MAVFQQTVGGMVVVVCGRIFTELADFHFSKLSEIQNVSCTTLFWRQNARSFHVCVLHMLKDGGGSGDDGCED